MKCPSTLSFPLLLPSSNFTSLGLQKRRQRDKAKAEQEAYDRKFEQEGSSYYYFGRGGGGAPVKDAEGNVRADLRNYLADGGPPQVCSRQCLHVECRIARNRRR